MDPILLKEKVLSAQELFKYRKPLDKTVPNRGGTKDFEPDGSFLQSKWIESLSQERSKVLREQRVEREGGLVKGEWNKDLKLVELEREMGKFWTYMGFVDSSRKWLFPEEALFLMETNTMVVNYKGLPLSIQQAYSAFLGSVAMTPECYQVYAHLRRLGYVVLRHQGCLDVTKYERKIHLDQHVKIDKKKRRHKEDSTSDIPSLDKGNKKVKVSSEDSGKVSSEDLCNVGSEDPGKFSSEDLCNVSSEDSGKESTTEHLKCSPQENCGSAMEVDGPFVTGEVSDDRLFDKVWGCLETADLHGAEFKNKESMEEPDAVCVPYSRWEFDQLGFPNIGGVEVLELKMPRLDLLPEGIDLSTAPNTFDALKYLTQQRKHKKYRGQEQQESVENLEFSYAEMIHKKRKITASNWGEFKRKMAIRDLEDESTFFSPAECLWEGEITPLVRPADATSTRNILNRLHIIENVNLTKKPRPLEDTPVKSGIIFDVYLPDAKFRKSRPGIPNYRVYVSKNHESPPSLQRIVTTQGSFKDGVPVCWAVLDHGDIAFYQFSDVSLPQEVSMG